MAVFRFKGDSLHMSIHGSKGVRGKISALRVPTQKGSKEEHRPPNGKDAFEADDEITVTDPRSIRVLSVDPRFELVSE